MDVGSFGKLLIGKKGALPGKNGGFSYIRLELFYGEVCLTDSSGGETAFAEEDWDSDLSTFLTAL